MTMTTDSPEVDYDSVGTDDKFVQAAAPQVQKEVDDALGLQPISIRLQKELLDNLKGLAQLNGLGYQPLIRQILTRWVDSEMKILLKDRLKQELRKANLTETVTSDMKNVEIDDQAMKMAA